MPLEAYALCHRLLERWVQERKGENQKKENYPENLCTQIVHVIADFFKSNFEVLKYL